MSKIVRGFIDCRVRFEVQVEKNESILWTVFPDGWDGEMSSYDITIESTEEFTGDSEDEDESEDD